ncbi:MAG: LapA family protein [Firmicutes bacterium]|nr:LapA family protein [Bacillota bacterium]
MQFYLLGGLLLAFVVAVFAVQNARPVDVSFLVWRLPDLSLVLVIFWSAVLGALVVFLPAFGRQLRLALRVRELESRNRQLTEELRRVKGEALAGTPGPGTPPVQGQPRP